VNTIDKKDTYYTYQKPTLYTKIYINWKMLRSSYVWKVRFDSKDYLINWKSAIYDPNYRNFLRRTKSWFLYINSFNPKNKSNTYKISSYVIDPAT